MQRNATAAVEYDESVVCAPECMRNPPLSRTEQAHWLDFIADEAEQGAPHGFISTVVGAFLGAVFRGFRAGVLLFAPAVPRVMLAEAVPPPLRPENLRQKTELFDRLAGHYGDKYRGSVIVIYSLGFAAVSIALSGVVLAQTAFAEKYAQLGPALVGAEWFLLMWATLIHLRGRSSRGVHIPSGSRWWTHRWHERWLDYRGLAERFRYAELHIGAASAASREPSAADDWCTRYFNQELARTAATSGSAPHRAAILRAAIHEQQQYHHCNANRCAALNERLHSFTGICFGGAAAFVGVELALELRELGTRSIVSGHENDWWLYATAGLPALAAALHGIESGCEWSKLARSSAAIARALDELRTSLDTLLRSGHDLAAHDDTLRSLISRFIQVTTDELTGWRATLLDKNVPLAG